MPTAQPEGLLYRPEFVSADEERHLLAGVEALAFSEIRMRGQVARRRTAHFGWLYGYESWRIEPGPPLPEFLLPLREPAAALAGVAPAELVEVLVTEYPPGAGIGWHRDAPMFGIVIGISLGVACRMRFRRSTAGPATAEVTLEPRSAYVLDGPVRYAWQHTIPPIASRRYSITYRTLRKRDGDAKPRRPS